MVLKAVLMAGGRGERFWPFSTEQKPKQCLRLFGKKSMVETTVERLYPLIKEHDIHISTGNMLHPFLKKLLPDVQYVIEPIARNTAACIGLSALSIQQKFPDAVLFIETTDHVYTDKKAYHEHIRAGVALAEKGQIVCFGIKPTYPHTGYGYIKQGTLLKKADGSLAYSIAQFTEKPDLATATAFLASKNYLWNAGVFIAKAKTILDTIAEHLPVLYTALVRIRESKFDAQVLFEEFSKLPSVSFDRGIMEKAKHTAVLYADLGWDDVGDWDAMQRILSKDRQGNVISGICKGTFERCTLFADVSRTIEADGLLDLIVADTPDAVLVCKAGESQKVRDVVMQLSEKKEGIIQIDSRGCTAEGDGFFAFVGVQHMHIHKTESFTRVILR